MSSGIGMFCQKLNDLRQSTESTQTQLSERTVISKTAMTNCENLRKTPSLEASINNALAYRDFRERRPLLP